MTSMHPATVLIVPGLRDHVADHWQTHLQHDLPDAFTLPPLQENGLSCGARMDALDAAIEWIGGPVILVAHSAGCLTTVHWALRTGAAAREIVRGALLVTPPDLNATWPAKYPSPEVLARNGWSPVPRTRLPFRSIVAASDDDGLASLAAVRAMAQDWGSKVVELGPVGHMNPASGFGPWPMAHTLIADLATGG
jgi:predicted alpha/beta hydrolase family esterase